MIATLTNDESRLLGAMSNIPIKTNLNKIKNIKIYIYIQKKN
jgi:hypothetical protein